MYLCLDGDGKGLRKPFVAMLLLIILIITCGEGKTAIQKQYEAVTVDVKRADLGGLPLRAFFFRPVTVPTGSASRPIHPAPALSVSK